MGELVERAFTEQRLLDAWEQVRDSALADGDAGPEVDRFEATAARHVSELAEALRDGTFQPRPVVRVEIAKAGGGVRRLAVPCLADRIVERALLAELDAVVDPLLLPWSFAYRHGLGVRDAVACLTEARDGGAAWVARCDIDDCFERIPRWEVVRRLREVVTDLAAVDLVRRFMDRPVIGERVARPERGLGLHQGSPLSPLLCNLYLDGFDRAMLGRGYRAIRYSDDIAIPVTDRGSAERALSDVAGELADLGLNLKRIRQVVCVGRVGLTTPFMQRAVRDGIDVMLLDEHGGPGGRLTSLAHSDPTARRAQYRIADDEAAARKLARAFVDGKIANMRVSLLRAGRRAPDPAVASAAETLAITRLVLADAVSHEVILGHEGTATREYFRAWRRIIGDGWGFAARERRPPPDPVNAMLSFGYTMLVQEAIAALEMAGLDAAVGFLHQARWGRPCLALDLMEEFRPTIVDAVVLRCLSTGIVRFEEFETVPDRGCRMNARARQAFLAAYERRMLTVFTHEPTGRRVSYRVGICLQAKALARAILDPERVYRPVRWK